MRARSNAHSRLPRSSHQLPVPEFQGPNQAEANYMELIVINYVRALEAQHAAQNLHFRRAFS